MSGLRRSTTGVFRFAIPTLLAAVTTALLAPAAAHAEPYMALRDARRCSTCHVNMTRGGMRTLIANTHLEDITHYYELFPELEDAAEPMSGQINEWVSLGGNLRFVDSLIFQDSEDEQGRVPHQGFRGRLESNEVDLRRFSLYGNMQLVPGYLSIYADLRLAPGGVALREGFGLLRGVLPAKGYMKAGRFFIDYGLGFETDDLFSQGLGSNENVFVRGRTGTDFTGIDEGLEIGFEPGLWHFALSVTDGASGDTDVRLAVNAYRIFKGVPGIGNAMLGASFLRNASSNVEQFVWGAYGGLQLGPLNVLAEIDFIRELRDDVPIPRDEFDDFAAAGDDTTASLRTSLLSGRGGLGGPNVGRIAQTPTRDETVGTFLAYGEVNYQVVDWMNVKAFGEYADNNGRGGDNGRNSAQNRFGFGVEPFLGRFLQARLYYTVSNGPKQLPELNQNRLILELHVFF